MGVRIAVELVGKEQCECNDCNRVGPQVLAEQRPHQADLDSSVPQQEECGEGLGTA